MSNQSKLFQLIQLEFLQRNYLETDQTTHSSFENYKNHFLLEDAKQQEKKLAKKNLKNT